MEHMPKRTKKGAPIAPDYVDQALMDPKIAPDDGGIEIGRGYAQPATHRAVLLSQDFVIMRLGFRVGQ
jgi:hypothetical protein